MANQPILNTQQNEAVRHGSCPLLIIAGAGTGKTTVVTERIKYLILEKRIPPTAILALTFTEKAAKEMEERVDIAMPYGYTQMWISTFHAFCDRILRAEAIHIGLNPSYKLLTETESMLFLRSNLFSLNLNYFRPLGNPNKFLGALIQHFNRIADEDISPDEYLLYAKKLKTKRYPSTSLKTNTPDADKDELKKSLELANAFKIYSDLKAKEGVMDFSDLITNTLKLFRERKNILRQYQEQFQFVLVDEFQDTNFAQNQLAILLAGDKKNITVVGDDDQAIYRWRGAAISNMIQFKTQFPKSKIITLTKNYRSTQEILDKSHTLIQNNNPDRLEVKEKINKKLTAVRKKSGQPIDFLFATRIEDEANLVVAKIQKLTTKGTYQYKDISILVRANDHAQAFVKSLNRYNIPFQFLGPGRLFHQEEIKDIISYLKVLYNFEDSTALYRVLTMPIFLLNTRDIAAMLNIARKKNLTLFEVLERIANKTLGNELFLQEETTEKITNITNMLQRHLKLVPKESAGQILYYFLNDTGMLKLFLTPKADVDTKKYQNIAKFFDKLRTYEAEHEDASVFAVIEWIDICMQLGESPLASDTDWSDNNAVNILTIHSSKGLEFSVVFLVNLVNQRFPTRERREQIPISQALIKEILPEGDFHLEEERRLFYVGMTRARDQLFLTAANFYGEGKREKKISPFVYETLGEAYVNEEIGKRKLEQTVMQPSLLEWAEKRTYITQQEKIIKPVAFPVTYLSFSQIQCFDMCPLHYKLRYILKIPPQPVASQSFGTSIHYALRDYYQRIIKGLSPKPEDVLPILEQYWIDEGYTSKIHRQEALERAKHILITHTQKHYALPQYPLGVEIPFQFFITDQTNKRTIKLGGRIDRVDKVDNNKIEIIDYKTGANIPEENQLKENLQLTLYALAAMNVKDKLLNRNPEDVLLSLYYIEDEKKLSTNRNKEQLEAAKELIFKKVDEIEKSDFACNGGMFCRNCEYKIICSI